MTMCYTPIMADENSDWLNDSGELTTNTGPRIPYFDDDGLLDGEEVLIYGSNPKMRGFDHDGMEDGDEAVINRNPMVDEPSVIMFVIGLIKGLFYYTDRPT